MSDLNKVKQSAEAANKKAARAVKGLVVGLTKSHASTDNLPQSKKLDDPLEQLVADGTVIDPPFDLLSLSMLPEMNSEMNQVIECMETNIEGFGHRLVPRVNVSGPDAPDELKAAVEKERIRLENFFEYASLDDSMISLRRKLRRDLETTGNAYLEVIRDAKGNIQAFEHIPSYQIRLGRLPSEPTQVNVPILELQDDGSVKLSHIPTVKRFRPFVQGRASSHGGSSPSHHVRWFKSFGDPRVMDNTTGEIVPPEKVLNYKDGKPMPEVRKANELVHFKIYAARSPYGIPRYIGNLLSIYGDRKAEEINYYTFRNNNIPSMMLLVSNGQLTQGTIDRINEFAQSQISGQDNWSKMLILEAEGEFEGEDAGNVKLDVKPMTDQQHSDALFQEYSKNNQDKIRRAWRLPPILVGRSELYNRATAETARKLADEQIFAPERNEFDAWVNRKLFPHMGIIYHKYRSNSPNTTDNTELVKIITNGERTGAVTPRISRALLEDILGDKDLPPFKEDAPFDPDIPFSLTMAEAVKNKADPTQPGQQVTALKSLSRLKLIKELLNGLQDTEDLEELLTDGPETDHSPASQEDE